jgi:exosortase
LPEVDTLSDIVSIMPPLTGQIPGGGLRARTDRGAAGDLGSVAEESFLKGLRDRLVALRDDLRDPVQRQPLASMLMLAGVLIFSYWPGLLNAKAAWVNAQYSHGWLVPLFTVAMLFWWRKPIHTVTWSARLAGMLLLVASVGVRLVMARYRIITIDMYSFVPALGGVVLLCGGWGAAWWAWAPVAFLIFMYPLPDEATRYLLGPLQTLATSVSTFAIQTLGVDAIREGNKIIVGERHLGVVDACSGLRMLTIFIALSVAIVMTGDHDWLDGLVIVMSSVPIALFVNAVRITATGLMYTVNADLADKLFHDWAGYFMMPMALGLLFVEQKVLGILRVAAEEDHGPTLVAGPAVPVSEGRAGLLVSIGRLASFVRSAEDGGLVRLADPGIALRRDGTALTRENRDGGRPSSVAGAVGGGDSGCPPPVVVGTAARMFSESVRDFSGPPPIVVPTARSRPPG